jgi:acyl-CoA synthetase (AMP-forming)/AMP-acid ligase II
MVSAAYRAGGTAVIGEGRRWAGPDLLARAAGAATWLSSLEIPPGTPVPALFSRTSGEAMACTLAAAAVDRPLAPLGPRLTTRELVPMLAGLGSAVVIADSGAAALAGRLADVTGARVAVVPSPLEPSAAPLPEPGPDAIAGYLHTSGTTGLPKAVALRQSRLAARVRVNIGLLGLDAASVWVTPSPWHHIAGSGSAVVAMAAGAAVVEAGSFSVDAWTRLRRLRPTHDLLVPSMLEMLLAADALGAGSLRVLQYGAAPIHPGTLRRLLEAVPGVRLVQLFGQTEGSPITCLSPEDHRRARREPHLLRSVGRAVPGLEIRIEDPDPDTGVGQVVARADHLFRLDADGWLRTGDLGLLDDEGFLFLSGRMADKIVRGGENVFPVEVEDVLLTHPSVAEAGVAGLPDRRLGDIVAAFVVPADPEAPPSADDLRAYARERLAGFKVPTHWRFVERLPRNASGKLMRRRLTDG